MFVSLLSNRRKGFTLLELIVVIVILALLAALSIPTFKSVNARTHDETARSELAATIRNAAALAAIEEGAVVDLASLTTAAQEVAFKAYTPGAQAAENTFTVVQAPAASTRYGQISYASVDDVAAVAMLSRSGNCVLGRVEGTSGVSSWVAKTDNDCIADPSLTPGETPTNPGNGEDEEVVDDPTKPPVQGLTAVASDARVTLSWDALPEATGYRVYRNGEVLLAVPTAGEAKITYVDNQVTNGVEYTYQVSAYDERGNWEKSSSAAATPLPPLPDVPAAPAAAFKDSGDPNSPDLAVSWRPVLRADSYQVYVDGVLRGITDKTTLQAEQFEVNTSYQVTVAAQNIYGTSAQSDATTVLAEQGVPGTPQPRATNTWSDGFLLQWDKVSNASTYRVYNGETFIGQTSSLGIMIRNLQPSTGYTFYVRAVNHSGAGAAGSVVATTSEVGNPTPPAGSADVPEIDGNDGSNAGGDTLDDGTVLPIPSDIYELSAKPYARSVDLTWKTQSAATGYDVYRDGVKIGSATRGTYTDIGLEPSTSYRYFVVGTGVYTLAPSKSITVQTRQNDITNIPSAPTSVSAQGENAAITVTWASSPGANGYRIYLDGVLQGVSSSTSTRLTGLSNGQSYRIQVSAFNSAGESGRSGGVNATPQAPSSNQAPTPATPTGLNGSVEGSNVKLSWNASANASGYRVYRDGLLVSLTTNPSAEIRSSGGTSNVWTVSAINSSGESAQSAGLMLQLPTQAPTNFTVTLTGTQAQLAWKQEGQASYWVVYQNGTQVSTYFAPKAVISNLVNGQSYSFYVVAYGNGGVSAQSGTRTITPVTTPAPVSNLRAALEGNAVVLNWDVSASSAAAPVSGYRIFRDNVMIGVSETGTFRDSNAGTNTTRSYHVVAYGPAGTSASSNRVSISTPPSTPSGLSATATSSGVGLVWNATNGATSYSLMRNGAVIYTGSVPSFSDTAASSAVDNVYRVAAVNSAGSSSYSSEVTTVKLPAAPVLSATASSEKVTVSWTAVSGATSYRLYRSTDGNFNNSLVAYVGSGRSFTDNTVNNASTYTYWVTASNRAGESALSSAKSVTPSVAAPNATNLLTVTWANQAEYRLKLGWNSVSSSSEKPVESYSIWKNGELIDVVSHTGASTMAYEYTLLPGESGLTFGVSTNGPGGSSAAKEVTSNAFRPAAPTAPNGLKVEAYSNIVHVSWDQVASTSVRPVSGYNVYINGSLYTSTDKTAVILKGMTINTNYAVQVSAYGSGESELSNTVTATTRDVWAISLDAPATASFSSPNGLFEWFGVQAGNGTWVNPANKTVTLLSGGSSNAFDHTSAEGRLNVDLGENYRFLPTSAVMNRFNNTAMPLEGSNDGINWTSLGSVRKSGTPTELLPKESYRYLRTTGNVYEIELYGVLHAK